MPHGIAQEIPDGAAAEEIDFGHAVNFRMLPQHRAYHRCKGTLRRQDENGRGMRRRQGTFRRVWIGHSLQL